MQTASPPRKGFTPAQRQKILNAYRHGEVTQRPSTTPCAKSLRRNQRDGKAGKRLLASQPCDTSLAATFPGMKTTIRTTGIQPALTTMAPDDANAEGMRHESGHNYDLNSAWPTPSYAYDPSAVIRPHIAIGVSAPPRIVQEPAH